MLMRRVFLGLLFGLGLMGGAQAQTALEDRYAAPGPLAVTRQTVLDDRGAKRYEVFAPVPLLRAMPAITWGNGTGALPRNYDELLSHLASWGFVVIDTYERNTGTGAEILGAAQFLADQAADPASPLFGRLDASRIGAAGHSQGATGVINAATNFATGSLIRTVVPIALPRLSFSDPEDQYDTSLLEVPLFLISGTEDGLISPLSTNNAAFRRADDALPAAMGLSRGSGHNEIQPDGGKERGYLTAWMMFQLRGDPIAAGAFSGPAAELLTNPRWKSAKTQSMP
jgi:hypothetical protein